LVLELKDRIYFHCQKLNSTLKIPILEIKSWSTPRTGENSDKEEIKSQLISFLLEGTHFFHLDYFGHSLGKLQMFLGNFVAYWAEELGEFFHGPRVGADVDLVTL